MNLRVVAPVALSLSMATSIGIAQGCSQLKTQYDQAKAGLQRDVTAINNLGFDQTVEGLQEWEAIGKRTQEKAHDELVGGLVSVGLQSMLSGTQVWGSLTPPQANAFTSDLKRFGIDSKPWFDSLREIAYTPGKPAAVKPVKDFIDGTSHLMDAIGVLPNPDKAYARIDMLEGAISFAGGFAV